MLSRKNRRWNGEILQNHGCFFTSNNWCMAKRVVKSSNCEMMTWYNMICYAQRKSSWKKMSPLTLDKRHALFFSHVTAGEPRVCCDNLPVSGGLFVSRIFVWSLCTTKLGIEWPSCQVLLLLGTEKWKFVDLWMGRKLQMILLMAEIRLTSWGTGSLSHYLQGFSTIPGGARFQPSTVWIQSAFFCAFFCAEVRFLCTFRCYQSEMFKFYMGLEHWRLKKNISVTAHLITS